jgi:hypothetical protein
MLRAPTSPAADEGLQARHRKSYDVYHFGDRVRQGGPVEHLEPARHHAHHLERRAVDDDGLADDCPVTAELPQPQIVTEHDRRVGTGRVWLSSKARPICG